MSQSEFPFVKTEVEELILPWDFRIARVISEKFDLELITSFKTPRSSPLHCLVLGLHHNSAAAIFNWVCHIMSDVSVKKGHDHWYKKKHNPMGIVIYNRSVWHFTSSLLNCRGRSLDIALYPASMKEQAMNCILPCVWH